jgi:1-acyl-sn-glycerol-3-phosphate acyltransferase
MSIRRQSESQDAAAPATTRRDPLPSTRLLLKIYRTVGTGLGFVVFGAAGLVVGVLLVPLVHLFTPSQRQAELRVQRLVQLCFRSFLEVAGVLRLARFSWEGAERLRQPGVLVVANHPTLLDVVSLIACMPQAYCVIKQANFENAFIRSAARAAGYLSNADGVQMVKDCAQLLREGHSLLLFPEGTRSTENGMGVFHRGWAHIALQSGRDPLPAMINCSPPTLMKGQKWYEIPERAFHLSVQVGSPLSVDNATRGTRSRGRAARALNAALREYFEKGLARADV